MGLCERCADKSSSNYHAWCHRQWVLQKAPYLLKYEPRLTEKFIRKHIGDYSGYNHRQHMLSKLLETGFYEPETIDYPHLMEYVKSFDLIGPIETLQELCNLILPNLCVTQSDRVSPIDDAKCKTLLYSLNIAAYDLQLCTELTAMYGYREAFECHRRAVLKFIVDNCRRALIMTMNRSQFVDINNSIKNEFNIQYDDIIPTSKFLDAIQLAEGQFGELHRKWCTIFLGFAYD